jgi:hypothetical protein
MRLLDNGIALHVFNAFVLLLVLETGAAMLPSSRALDLKFHNEFRVCLRTLMIPHDKLAVHLKLTAITIRNSCIASMEAGAFFSTEGFHIWDRLQLLCRRSSALSEKLSICFECKSKMCVELVCSRSTDQIGGTLYTSHHHSRRSRPSKSRHMDRVEPVFRSQGC